MHIAIYTTALLCKENCSSSYLKYLKPAFLPPTGIGKQKVGQGVQRDAG